MQSLHSHMVEHAKTLRKAPTKRRFLLKIEFKNPKTGQFKVAKIYRDVDFEEYVVEFHVDGKHEIAADYHTDCKTDAFDTAKYVTKGRGNQ